MDRALSAAIFAARDLAWHSHVNLSSRKRYADRLAAHVRLEDALARCSSLSANASAELRYLVAAIYRVAGCSFANRRGVPYYERKVAMAELRAACSHTTARGRLVAA